MARASAEDLRHTLPSIGAPTLVICGSNDTRAPLAVGRALHAGIAGSTLVVLPDIGHVCNIEAPDEFNRTVRAFLGPDGQ
jgi:pimeloyl-ACP methyl ester carboxylesterase